MHTAGQFGSAASRPCASIIHLKAFGADGARFGVKAISPKGQLHDIKGLNLSRAKLEAKVNGVDVAAHVKALPQVPSLPN